MPLNFGGQKRSGAFDMVWPPANMVIKEIMTIVTGESCEMDSKWGYIYWYDVHDELILAMPGHRGTDTDGE